MWAQYTACDVLCAALAAELSRHHAIIPGESQFALVGSKAWPPEPWYKTSKVVVVVVVDWWWWWKGWRSQTHMELRECG